MPTSTAERRLAAIVAADVVGYSRLMGTDETATLAALRAHRTEVIDPLIAKHKGHIVNTTGDGLLLEFPSVVEAVACAIEVQRVMAERNRQLSADRRFEFRIGINIGDVIVEDGDVFGDGVNIAARLEQISTPGGICLSEDAYRHIRGKLEVDAVDAGEQRLKNIARPVRAYRINPVSRAKGPIGLASPGAVGPRLWPMVGGLAVILIAIAALVAWSGLGRAPAPEPHPATLAADKPDNSRSLPILAVLPFSNQTGDAAQDYFADGVTEEVINALGRFNTLRVIGRNAMLAYKNRPAAHAEIASELGATYLVDGSVRRSDRRVRISAQLTEAGAGTVLWTDRYDGELSDIFDFQDSIAREIAGTLAANITQVEVRRRLDAKRPDKSAFDLVLRARAIGMASSRSANRQYRELMTKAIELDPGYATANALLAEAIYTQVVLGWTEFPDRELSRAEELARRAVALASGEPDGYRALGRIHMMRAEYDQAGDALRRAVEINPSDANALAVWGAVQTYSGEIPGAIEALESALKYDPMLEPSYSFDLSVSYYLARRHEDALRIAEHGISRFPGFAIFNVTAAAAAAQLGRKEQARRYVAEIHRRLPFFDVEGFGSRFKVSSHPAYFKEGLRLAGL